MIDSSYLVMSSRLEDEGGKIQLNYRSRNLRFLFLLKYARPPDRLGKYTCRHLGINKAGSPLSPEVGHLNST